jgi:carboxypeptidase family protein/TonB-dependent receptor-like protein
MHQANLCRVVSASALIAVLVICGGGTVSVEAQAVRATILGSVRDSTGAALPGATVDVKNVSTGVIQSSVADGQGRYNIPELIVGTYEVSATLQGFGTVVQQNITLTIGAQRVVDFELPVGSLQESITVEGAAAQVDVVSAAVTTTIEQKQIAELPLNGRNYAQLIILAPGVQSLPGANNGSLFGRQNLVSVSGARPQGQAYLLDNTNIANFWNRAAGSGVLGTTLGVESIAEFNVLTGTYSAQFGANGAVINAVTKSGTNSLHGSLFEFIRHSRFDAKNFFDPAKLPFRQDQFGGSLGGPLKSDKAFFFVNYEGIRRDLTETRIANVPDQNARAGIVNGVNVGVHPAIAPILALYPLPTVNLGGGIGTLPQVAATTGDENYYLGRVDYTPTQNDTIFGRFVYDKANLYEPFAGSSIPTWDANNSTSNTLFTAEHRRILTTSMINQLRFGFVRTDEIAENLGSVPELSFFPNRMNGSIVVAGLSTIGANQLNPFDLLQRKYTFADDVYWNKGSHAIRLGVEAQRVESDTFAPFQWGAAWTFNSLTTLLQNQPTSVNSALPGQDSAFPRFREWDFVGYVHDEWRATESVTLNLGVRYAPTTNPTVDPGTQFIDPPFSAGFTPVETVFASNPSLRNWDPRVGFAWDMTEDHKMSLRGGLGVFHDIIQARVYSSAYYINPPYQLATETQPIFPTPFVTPRTGAIVSQGIDYDTDTTPYMMQWNLNLQREIAPATVVTVGYVGTHGENFFKQRDVNPVSASTVNGQPVYGTIVGESAVVTRNPRLNPRFQSLNFGAAFADSDYHSLQLSFNRRFYENLQSQISYTLSKCEDISSGNFGGEGGTASTNPYDPEYDRGPCSYDRTHAFRGSAVYALPFTGNPFVEGWQLSGIVNLSSGAPFSPIVGDISGLGTANQRPSIASGASLDNAVKGGIVQYFDPTVFVMPAPGTVGDAGRNSLRGPGFATVDMSLSKNVDLPRAASVQFRVEGFNLLNRANFATPVVNSATPLLIGPRGTGTINPAAGRITTLAGDARRMQFAVKVLF